MHVDFRMLGTSTAIFLIALLFAGNVRADSEFVQPQAVFEKAIRNTSTNKYIVYVTAVDDNTGERTSGCVEAALLRTAILWENDLGSGPSSLKRAIQIALDNPSHVFHFSKRAAIHNVPLDEIAQQQKFRDACVLVKQGRSVFLADLTAEVLVDP